MNASGLLLGDGLLPTLALAAVGGSAALALGLLAGATLLRGRAGARHAVVLAALVVYTAAPLAVLGARRLPAGARRLADPVARALALAEAPGLVPAPAGAGDRRRVGTAAPAGAGAGWLVAVWALGAAGLLLRLAVGARQVRRLRRGARPVAPEVDAWARALLLRHFPGRRLPALLASPHAGSPLLLGLRRPAILLPPAVVALPRAELGHVLVHEMGHLLRGDLAAGWFTRLALALHWPNPLVHLAGLALARAREESCDDLVLAGAHPTDYARTLLAVATGVPAHAAPALAMGAGRGELERRIRRMLSRPQTARREAAAGARLAALAAGLGGAALVTLAAAAAVPGSAPTPALTSTPALASAPALALASPATPAGPRTPAAGAVRADDGASALFREAGASVTGAFVLRELGGALTVVNPQLAAVRFTPASTFKVVIAAAALETGVLSDERTVWKWNGEPQPFAAWRRDLDLAGAMKLSSNWYFDRLYHAVGAARVDTVARRLRFAPADAAGPATWIDGGYVVSALDQVAFLERFAAGELPLAARTQEILRRILVLDERAGVTLRGKTGTAEPAEGGTLAWLVGTVEAPGRRLAYAAVFRGAPADVAGIQRHRHAITRRLLARHGALPAEMAP
jgi:beta-lactamase class D/beta-lactamase regulating signal transducer with metallopeptidase domain